MNILEFMGSHPWLTFFIILIAGVTITNVVANICKTILAKSCSDTVKEITIMEMED